MGIEKVKRKKSPTGLIIILLITAAAVLLVRHFHIKRFRIIEQDVLYTSSQPRGMDYTRLLYKYHIVTIVNVRSSFEHRERNWYNEEITWVRENSVEYVELPIDRKNYFPDEETQKAFLDVMADRTKLPVLLHGSGGKRRTLMLAAVWLIKGKGLSVEETLKKIERFRRQPLTEEETKFITQLSNYTLKGNKFPRRGL